MKVRVRQFPIRVPGFRFAGVRCGLKESRKRDVAVIASDVPAAAAAAFTTNRVKAAPVLVGIERAKVGRLQALVINSGNANAYTGRDGVALAREMCAIVARALGINERLVIPSSTGRIGVPVPRDRVRKGVRDACRHLSPDGFHDALEGIMTTDAFPKFATEGMVVDGREVTIAGMTKGAGMIAPRMTLPHATNLTYVMTDVAASPAALRRVLKVALPQSFNAAVVDGDTSTNDTLLLLASGAAQNRPVRPGSADARRLVRALTELLEEIARLVVLDGEGAVRLVEVTVRGARSDADAERVARAIGDSPLCKTAFNGGDPNWGRFVMAAGKAGVPLDADRVDVTVGGVAVSRRGRPVAGALRRAARRMRGREVAVGLDLHLGRGRARILASDLSTAYVHFNAAYTT
jgi:glutamate N-acetyltransferase/amino-acid N-acetyltransferase